MHWLCFHIAFEHGGDPDEPCADVSCPRWHEQVYKQKLAELGHDPQKVLDDAVDELLGP
jgi:hypothetical protein